MDILRHFFFLLFLLPPSIPCSTFVFLPSLSGSAPRVDSEIIMWCNPTVDQTHPVCDRTKIHSMPVSLSLILSSFHNFHRASASFNSTGERSYFIESYSLCRVPRLLQPFFAIMMCERPGDDVYHHLPSLWRRGAIKDVSTVHCRPVSHDLLLFFFRCCALATTIFA